MSGGKGKVRKMGLLCFCVFIDCTCVVCGGVWLLCDCLLFLFMCCLLVCCTTLRPRWKLLGCFADAWRLFCWYWWVISSLRSIVFDSCSSVSQFFSFFVAGSELVMFKEAGGPFQFFVFGDLFCQLSCWTMLLLFTSLEIVLGKLNWTYCWWLLSLRFF